MPMRTKLSIRLNYFCFLINILQTKTRLLQFHCLLRKLFAMKKLIVIVMCATVFAACKKTSSTSYTPDCTGTAKSYATNVAPLFSGECNSCHSEYSSYAGISADKSRIRNTIVDGSMPKRSSLTNAEKNNIVCWIDNGAPNN